MSLTAQQKYQLLLSVIEEAQRLARKFGLNDGVAMLEEFKKSLHTATNPQSLFNLIEEEKLFKKAYKEKQTHLNQLVANIFGFDLPSKKVDEDFIKILSPSEKEIKKITSGDVLVFDHVIAYVKENIRDYIKEKFGVTKADIREARALLEKRFLASSAETATTVIHIARIAHLLLKDKKPLNFKFNGISINGLYKLIKIINGIQNDHLTQACVGFFAEDNEENHLIMRAFFAAEKTEQYCRNSSLLVQSLALLVNQDLVCNKICDSFVKGILGGSETSVKALLENNKEGSGNDAFIEFLSSVLNTAIHFRPILDIAMQDLANRDLKITQLQASQDALLKSAFYFGLISPLLAQVENKLTGKWPDQARQQFRLELSLAFDIMLGLKSPDKIAKIKSAGVICPALFDLVSSPLMEETVKRTFTAIGTSKGEKKTREEKKSSSATLGYLADSENSETMLQKKATSPRNVTTSKPTSTQEEPQEKASSSTKSLLRDAYANKTRAISFYKSSGNSQIETPRPAPSAELTRKRSTSALAGKKNVLPTLSAVPMLSIPAKKNENTLEGYFNDLFTCDREKATLFVLSLVRTKDVTKFSWGIQVLNEACDKTNKQIADVLINNLSQSELLNVFDELLKGEKSDSWCRGNKLLPILIQQYMAKEECQGFKDFLWTTLYALAKPISNIKVQQRASMAMTPESFSAETADISSLQQEFSTVMKSMLASKNFPPLIQKFLSLAYADLAQREDIHNENDNRMRTFLGFILLRFINPIIQQEANKHLANQNLKMWYMKILPAAIQSLSAILSNASSSINPDGLDEEETLQEAIFDPVTKNKSLRTELFEIIRTGFVLVDPTAKSSEDLENPSEEKPKRTYSSITLNVTQCIRQLSELLKAEEFSGLNFKPNGSVTPRQEGPKPHVMSIFAPLSSDEDKDDNSSPTQLPGSSSPQM
ncbi:hypothetical protein [Legionella maioricensis]|uniref:Ras-GAP domain-containing protein n=1 Tax=Legionella maioricensis TaxID=2896528 RepID=A0A9X2ICF7_9GAMM|nr:hypothetical protein [Legionella maioricensis]MCL9685385.1 hypothetical protein [Legionella maioricensis]MCL9688656.1 hypothetical protein [Legionella maioricensis]